MKAFVERAPVGDDGRPVATPKGSAVGVRARYLTRDGITVFLLEDEPFASERWSELAQPGMVGVSLRGDVYLVDDAGDAHQLTTRLIGAHDYERLLSVEA